MATMSIRRPPLYRHPSLMLFEVPSDRCSRCLYFVVILLRCKLIYLYSRVVFRGCRIAGVCDGERGLLGCNLIPDRTM